MNNKVIFLLIFLVQIMFPQNITQEEKNEIINNLDSTRHSTRLEAIINVVKNGIIEARPKLEEKIFYQEKDIAIWYLRAIASFNSPNAISISHRFIDTIDYLPNPLHLNFTESSNRYKVQATEILFNKGDYSTTYIVFDYIEENKPDIAIASFYLLEDVLNHVPEFELQAKNELRRIMLGFDDDNYSPLSIIYLTDKYGQEMIPDLLDVLENVTSNTSRNIAFEELEELNYSELENLTKSQFLQDSVRSWMMLNKLLTDYNTPANYKFILDNYKTSLSMDQVAKYNLLFQSEIAIPSKDYNLVSDYLDFVYSLCDTLQVYNWLGNANFSEELKSVIQSAKTNLQNGDSLACREDVKTFKDTVDFVYADSLNADPRFVTLEGWKFLYWNAQYILDRLPEIPETEGINTYSVFATHGVWLEQNSEILSGNVGVNEIGTPPFMDSDVEMSIGISTETPAGFSVKANRIKVKQNATVNADVYHNELENNGTITGTLNTPLELPLFITLPEFHTSAPGTENIVIPQNGEYTLTPGAYGEIQVKKNGKLIFTGGEYHINNFNGGDNNQLLFQSETEVRIKDKFDSGQGSYIGPQDTTTLSADEIVFYVEGINGSNGNLGSTPKAAKIGISNTVKANFYVPNGTLWLRQNSEVEGAFIGKDVDVGIGVKVKLNSAF